VSNDDWKSEIQQLKEEVLLTGPDPTCGHFTAWVKKMVEKYGSENSAVSYDLLTIWRIQQTKVEITVDQSINAGRDVIGSTTGINNKVQMGDINSYNQAIDQSFSSNPRLGDALKEGAKAIHESNLASPIKDDVLNNYGKLTTELQKPKPDKAILQYLWGTFQSAVGTLKPIVELGKILVSTYGIVHAAGAVAGS
jgi:hypothetical protein